MTVYKASFDGFVIGVTVAVVVVLLAIAGGLLAATASRGVEGGLRLILGGASLLCIAIILISWVYAPREYRLVDRSLVVARPIGDVVLPMRQVVDAWVAPAPLEGAIRVMGNGGLFGFWGKFRSDALKGNFTMYGTRRHDGVVLQMRDQTVVVTPDQPERFVDDVRRLRGTSSD